MLSNVLDLSLQVEVIDYDDAEEDEINANSDDAFNERVTLIVCGIAYVNRSTKEEKDIAHVSSSRYFCRSNNHDNSYDEARDERGTAD